jgi:hypothetical protein
MVFVPPLGSPYVADRESRQMAHRVTISNHYNILSNAGFGPNQISACLDCALSHVYSHGGTVLRMETDGIGPLCGYDACAGGCQVRGSTAPPTGPNGQGFKSYGLIDNLRADHLEGTFGDRVVSYSPHCLPNGTAFVSDLKGTSMYELVRVAQGITGGSSGSFSSASTVTNVEGTGGDSAQSPAGNGYTLAASSSAISEVANLFQVGLAGTLCWPSTLADGDPVPGPYTLTHAQPCPSWPQ